MMVIIYEILYSTVWRDSNKNLNIEYNLNLIKNKYDIITMCKIMRFQKLMWHGIIRLTKRKTTLVVYMDACDYLKQCTLKKKKKSDHRVKEYVFVITDEDAR